MRTTTLLLCLTLPLLSCLVNQASGLASPDLRECAIEALPLPALNIPRSGHATVAVGGDVLVIGGHTSGFVPTPTAERWADGKWEVLPMTYSHDQALVVPLRSGSILIAGGHEQPLGIGQTFALELYDPATHTFKGFGCLDRKRAFADGAELDSGHVVISGNWYEADGTELFDGSRQCLNLADVSQQRAMPCVLRTAADDAIIFSCIDNHGLLLDEIVVDRLRGESFQPELLQTWRPRRIHMQRRSYDSFIGDEAAGCYEYILSAENSEREIALIRVTGTADTLGASCAASFERLPLSAPIPLVCKGDSIYYPCEVIADRSRQTAFLVGIGASGRFYIVEFDYAPALDGTPAPMVLHISQTMPGAGFSQPVITAEGNIIIAGGATSEGNFTPRASALLFPLGDSAERATSELSSDDKRKTNTVAIVLMLVACGSVIVAASLAAARRRKSPQPVAPPPSEGNSHAKSETTETHLETDSAATPSESIANAIRSRRLFQRSTLKLADLAADLDLPARTISEAVKEETGQTFSQFINNCRIDYAKQQLLQRPSMKLSTLAAEAGFANESNFYRTFKAITGLTPKDWLAANDISDVQNG